jgi:hypothetical protein
MLFTPSVLTDTFILLCVALFGWHIRKLSRQGRWTVFDPLNFFWVGVFVIYIIEVMSNYDAYELWYGQAVVEDAMMWTFVGLVFLHVGYHLRVGRSLAARLPALPAKLARIPFLWVSIAFIVAGLAGWAIIFDSSGGLHEWATEPRGNVDWSAISGYVGTIADLLNVGVFLFVVYAEWNRSRLVTRLLAWVLLGLLLFFFLYLGTRSRTILVVLIALMAWSLPRRRSPPVLALAVIFACLFVVVRFQEHYREHFHDLSFNFQEIDWDEVPRKVLPRFFFGDDSPSTAGRGTEFGITAGVVALVPDRIPYAHGIEFLQFFTQPIPRELWPGKRYPKNESWTPIYEAIGASDYWVDYVEVPFLAGPAPGFVASWYYNAGALGLLIGGLLVGIVLRVVRGAYDLAARNESYFIIYFLVGPVGFGEAVGHPFGFVYTLPLLLVPLAMMLFLIRRKPPAMPTPMAGGLAQRL